MTDSDKPQKTQEEWQEFLKSTDLRARFSTLRAIEKLIENENTSAQQLAKVVLNDILLTAQVLKVANSASHPNATPKQQETKVSEGALTNAIVRIGFNGLRTICISVSLLDYLTKNSQKNKQLQKCIETSFDIAVHARNIARRTRVNQEDAFLVGLLQNLGEILFWSSEIPSSAAFKEAHEEHFGDIEKAFKQLLGMGFTSMSKELASTWKLSELLTESFEKPVSQETQSVALACRINRAISKGWESKEMNHLLHNQLKTLGMNIMEATNFMREGAKEAKAMSTGYGSKKPSSKLPDPLAPPPKGNNKRPRKKKPPTSLIRS